jgi:hypothetical protein
MEIFPVDPRDWEKPVEALGYRRHLNTHEMVN